MAWKSILAASLLLVTMVPAADAYSIEAPSNTTTLALGTATSLPFNVTASCQDDLAAAGIMGQGSVDVTVSASDLPDWASAEDVTVTFDATGCLTDPTGSLMENGSIAVTANDTAPGMAPAEITLTADDATTTASVQADYRAGYMFMVEEGIFPLELGHDPVTFNATIHLFANARTMAMFQVTNGTDFVSVSGLPDFQTVGDDQLAGELEAMIPLTITVTPPETGSWEEDTFEFFTWSHFLDEAALMTPEETFTWTFVNHDDGDGGESDGDGDSNGIPGVAPIVTLLALLAAAFVVARRRA